MIDIRVLEGIKPERVMYHFEEISKIPRCSHEEQRISDHLVAFGKNLDLETIQDEALNVIIKKPGYKGYENSPTVVLQGHMDMVGEKTNESNHDFSTDQIKIEIDGDYIIARETTLGADNGIAVAMALSILESKDIPHPPLEVLITSNEEAGMTGAYALDPKHIDGKILINMDSEEEGTILVSCAGGERNLVTIPVKWEEIPKGQESYELVVTGLQGGHSGLEIDKGRANSNKIMGRTLYKLDDMVNISYIEGGSKSNAIPRYSKAILTIDKDKVEDVQSKLAGVEKEIKTEYHISDKDIKLVLKKLQKNNNKIFSKQTGINLIRSLMLIPNGIQSMSKDIEGLVESSINLGVVQTLEDSITIESAIRSSVGSLKSYISSQIEIMANLIGVQWKSISSYPAWEYNSESYIREIFKDAYRDIYGQDINIAAIHAGLECGVFDQKFEDMDMISFGPNMYGVHAPGEKLNIESTERIYKLLINVLERIK